MPDFKAKMHQIRFRLGLRPRPLAGLRDATSKGRGGEGGGGRKVGRGREKGRSSPSVRDALTPLFLHQQMNIAVLTEIAYIDRASPADID